MRADGSIASDHFFASGHKLKAVRAITYTFPDGHNVEATIRRNGAWSVAYTPTSGPLFDTNFDRIQVLDPPWVSVRYSNGYLYHIPLAWPRPSCRLSAIPPRYC